MAAYQPLRDAFREWNRMIIDGREFDKRHELDVMDRRMQERQLESNLATERFNMKLQDARMKLSERGEKRMADRLAMEQAGQTFRQMDTNRRWERTKRLDENAEALQEIQLKNAQLDQQIKSNQVERTLYASEEAPLDFSNYIPEDILQDPDRLSRLNKVANIRGYEIGSDGLAYDADGSVYTMKRYRQNDEAPWLLGRMLQTSDTHAEVAKRINTMRADRDALKKELNNMSRSTYTQHERVALTQEIHKIEGDIKGEESFFSLPAVQANTLDQKANLLRGAARAIAAQGDTDYANILMDEADDYRTKAMTLRSKGKNVIPLFDEKTGKDIGFATFSSITGDLEFEGNTYKSLNDIPNATTLDIKMRGAQLQKAQGSAKEQAGGLTDNQALNQMLGKLTTEFNAKGTPILSPSMKPKGDAMTEGYWSLHRAAKAKGNVDRGQVLNLVESAITEQENKWIERKGWIDKIPNSQAGKTAIKNKLLQLVEENDVRVHLDKGKINNFKALKSEYNRISNYIFKSKQKDLGIQNTYIPNEVQLKWRKFQQ